MSAAPQRRLAAILAADVVGYSRMVRADEEGTIAALKALRADVIDPCLTEHHGRIVKLMGDGMLVEFQSVVDAVRCAVKSQVAVAEHNADLPEDKRIAFRVGINLGDVVIDGDDIHGDGVNVAARLEGIASPGGICLSGAVHDQVKNRVEAAFEDLGEQKVKNIDDPVRVWRWLGQRAASAAPPPAPTPSLPPLPEKPSVAVLPFQNMSGDPEQEYFADGMVEDIITALSRARWLFVIARNSSFIYKGRAVDVKQVGRELGVRYVLEGSVRKAGRRVRITGQLIDAATGAHLWADRFDGELADIFDLQDQVTSSVVGAIAPRLEQAEIERANRKPTESLDAYDYYLRGMAAFHGFSKESNAEAVELFTKALTLDPKFASAYGMVARCYLQRIGFNWVTDRGREAAETERMARHAADLGRDDSIALAAAGSGLLVVVGDVKGGALLLERSLAINPNLAWAVSFSGIAKAFLGESDEALKRVAHAMRLSPQDPQMFGMQVGAAWAHFFAGRFEEALVWAEAALQGQSNFFVALCVEAASAAKAGKLDQAQKAMARVRELNPALRLSNLRSFLPFERKQDFDLWAEGLEAAGLPE